MDEIEKIFETAIKDYEAKIEQETNDWAKERLIYDKEKIEYRLELHRFQKR